MPNEKYLREIKYISLTFLMLCYRLFNDKIKKYLFACDVEFFHENHVVLGQLKECSCRKESSHILTAFPTSILLGAVWSKKVHTDLKWSAGVGRVGKMWAL